MMMSERLGQIMHAKRSSCRTETTETAPFKYWLIFLCDEALDGVKIDAQASFS
jgi:hypothetical protein